MSTIVTRSGKGSPLTHNEVDTNFTNLNTDKVEKTAADITGGAINNTTIGATTPSTGVFTTLTATGQTSLGGKSSDNTDVVRVYKNNTLSGGIASFTGPAFSFIPPQDNFGAAVIGLGLSPRINSTGTDGFWFATNQTVGFTGTIQAKIAHTASAVNYHQLTGSATGSGPIHSVAGSDTNIDNNLTSKGTGNVNLNSGNGTQFRVESSGSAATDFVMVGGSSTGRPFIRSAATSGNIDLAVSSQGTGSLKLYTNFVGQEQLRVAHTASAVNYVQVTGAATGASPTISTQGSDAVVSFSIRTKGTGSNITPQFDGSVFFQNLSAQNQFRVFNTASAVNYLQTGGSTAGSGLAIQATGSDTNIPLVLQPKGTGALQAQQTDSTATGGNARGANAVDWQTSRSAANQVASGQVSFVGGGFGNKATGYASVVTGGYGNTESNQGFVGGGSSNTQGGIYGAIVGGSQNTLGSNAYSSIIGAGYQNNAQGYFSSVLGGTINSTTSGSAVTTQSSTMNGTTAVTLSGSNASIKVGQLVTGTYIPFPNCYVAAISGTSLTLSVAASGSGTATLSFYTPHGVVVGGGNNQATGAYSFIGAGGDAGNTTNRNIASGDWSVVSGGRKNVASGSGSVVAGGGTSGTDTLGNTASGPLSTVSGGWNSTASGTFAVIGGGQSNIASGYGSSILGGSDNLSSGTLTTVIGQLGTARGISGNTIFSACNNPISYASGINQSALLILARQTTDATATRLLSDNNASATTNQVILPNNSAYYFRGEVVSGVTGGGNTKGWTIEGVIKRGANAASTALVGTPTVTSLYADAGAATWTIAVTADTTNGGLAVTFTGQASTTIRTVAQIRTTEMTY